MVGKRACNFLSDFLSIFLYIALLSKYPVRLVLKNFSRAIFLGKFLYMGFLLYPSRP